MSLLKESMEEREPAPREKSLVEQHKEKLSQQRKKGKKKVEDEDKNQEEKIKEVKCYCRASLFDGVTGNGEREEKRDGV